MCKGRNCPLKEKCYRYMAIPTEKRQSYFISVPFQHNECNQFYPIEGKRCRDDEKLTT